MAFDVTVIPADCASCRIRVSGTLETATVPEFEKAVEQALSDPDLRCIRLELEDMKYISSLGLGSIVKARKAIEARGGLMVTIGAQPQIRKVFQIVKMLPEGTLFASREEADEYLKRIQNQVIEEQARPSAKGAGA